MKKKFPFVAIAVLLVSVNLLLLSKLMYSKTTGEKPVEDSPPIKKDNSKELSRLKNQKITYFIETIYEEVPQEVSASWVRDVDGKIKVDKKKIKKYVTMLDDKYSTLDKNRAFSSTTRGEILVPPGIYGWKFKIDEEVDSLANDFLSGENLENRIPKFEGSGYGYGLNTPPSYIEVDLKEQHLWFYEEGKLSLQSDIVTGKPSTPTPLGVFYIWDKERNATLKNEDYTQPVSYWMPIDWSGVGLHDANWQANFGGKLYKENGSHGCINLPPYIAKKIFETANTGIAVYII